MNRYGLNPCPNCGNVDVYCTDAWEGRGYAIVCRQCGIRLTPFDKCENAFKAWNNMAKKAIVTDIYEEYSNDYIRYVKYGSCNNCHSVVEEGDKFCPECGSKLVWDHEKYSCCNDEGDDE